MQRVSELPRILFSEVQLPNTLRHQDRRSAGGCWCCVAASALLEKIEEGAINYGMRLRLITDKGWENLGTTEKVREAVSVLEDHGWVRLVQVKPPGRGRPSEQLYIHPDLREGG